MLPVLDIKFYPLVHTKFKYIHMCLARIFGAIC